MAERGFDRLVARTYDAVLDPGVWPDVLSRLRRETGAVAGGILQNSWSHDFSRGHFVQGIDARANDDYRNHFRHHIPWINVPELFRPGVLRTDRTINRFYNSANAFASTEYFNDWMVPQGFRHIMRAVVHCDDKECFSLFLFGDAALRGFEGKSETVFRRLLPHLMRATAIRRRLDDLQVTSSAITDAVDQLTMGVIYVDERGGVLGANRTADRMLARGDGLVTLGGRIMPARPTDGAAFDAALKRALPPRGTDAERTPPSSTTLTLSRSSDGLPLVVTLMPGGKDALALSFRMPAAVLLVADPLARPETAAESLVAVFGLTRSEARLATALVTCGRLREAAETVGITYETARSYLKVIFHKTGTRRQAELVRLLVASGS